MGFDTDIVNYGSTSSSLNIQLRFNIRRSAIHYQLVLFNAGMGSRIKVQVAPPPPDDEIHDDWQRIFEINERYRGYWWALF